LPWKASSGLPKDGALSNGGGEVWAATKNREHDARTRIVEALRKLGIPHNEWPDLVRDWLAKAKTDPTYSYPQIPPSFQPPAYDRLGSQTLAEWKAATDKAWAKHRDECIAEWRHWEDAGV